METSILEDQEVFEQLKGMSDWLNKKPCYDGYLIRLLDLIGSTMVGVKPAELLNIPINEGGTKNLALEELRVYFLRDKNIKFREIKKQKGRVQVLFYHSTSLDNALCSKASLRFLRGLGYPEQYSVEGYVDFLVTRLNRKDFPHEIGLFLGYPFKDVLGYIGHPSLKLVKINGWKIYGNDKLSNKRYESFSQARKKVRELISPMVN
ncbi:DUF3793 family protein [Desulfosporosinus nitroreducens]|uniref:DUF3793 family protein n=1 Tax=Desulfosporosinus nitroreducens TaxID=2018668 RepID=A0ABT8QPS3_9FIRM|nr:DUF3793 family protein [Desulfosporosinus nitroreducens]MDO0823135.1 DUF3793 family protein [Desulfosporosinus nitroreducens]